VTVAGTGVGEYRLAPGEGAQSDLDTIARSRDKSSWLLPEQVWHHQPPAGTGPVFQPGEPTFSATPLAWTHAQFIRLAWSIDTGAPVETPQPVACRYSSPICGHLPGLRTYRFHPGALELVSPQLTRRTAPANAATRVVASAPAAALGVHGIRRGDRLSQ
jgi:hypothetical protein